MRRSEQGALVPVAPDLMARVLQPYKPHCRYLVSARVEHPVEDADDLEGGALCRVFGEFSIGESCYIEDTGHLNAVEVNICYNQMLYILYAQGVVLGILPPLRDLTLDAWLARQLPDVLIRELVMTFRRVIDRKRFFGWMTFDGAVARRNLILFPSRCRFWDDQGGLAEGRVTVVVDDRAQAHGTRAGGGEARRD
jgi:hypothetical protein